uniref:Ribosomal protein S10 n=1 Tax=Dictyopteris divaricata TaxID=156996 RepID=A0A4Y5T8C0_9PHAE|nr:ribosomal protein S10 [Dictyopteris divaricata]QDB64110.1 ribosomal protein S10 [Dictyopteris divaricata]
MRLISSDKPTSGYKCKIWVRSTNKINLKKWRSVLPLNPTCQGLPTNIKRFTLIRAPLGSKKSKEQYELIEYGYQFCFFSTSASVLLKILDVIRYPVGVKLKISVLTGGS